MHFGTPPRKLLGGTGVENGKEDDDAGNGDGAVEGGREDEVVATPPFAGTALHEEAEKQADDGPTAVVGARGRRDVVEAAEEQRHVDLGEPGDVGKDAPPQEVDDDGESGAEEGEVHEGPVERPLGQEAPGAQRTPHHTRVEMSARERTREAVGGLVEVTNVGDMVQRPVDHRHLAQGSGHDARELDDEEAYRRDLESRSADPQGDIAWAGTAAAAAA